MTANKTLLLSGALAAAFGFCAVATAQDTGTMAAPSKMQKSTQTQPAAAANPDAKPAFEQLDKNHDGKLMRSEIPDDMHSLRAHFRNFDTNGDGGLSSDEYQEFANPPDVRRN